MNDHSPSDRLRGPDVIQYERDYIYILSFGPMRVYIYRLMCYCILYIYREIPQSYIYICIYICTRSCLA